MIFTPVLLILVKLFFSNSNIAFLQTLKAQLGLNEDQVREFKDAFDIFDEDTSGTVSTGELASVMKTLGQDIDEKEVGVMISEVDSDGKF